MILFWPWSGIDRRGVEYHVLFTKPTTMPALPIETELWIGMEGGEEKGVWGTPTIRFYRFEETHQQTHCYLSEEREEIGDIEHLKTEFKQRGWECSP